MEWTFRTPERVSGGVLRQAPLKRAVSDRDFYYARPLKYKAQLAHPAVGQPSIQIVEFGSIPRAVTRLAVAASP
jgi:hypothetical protein